MRLRPRASYCVKHSGCPVGLCKLPEREDAQHQAEMDTDVDVDTTGEGRLFQHSAEHNIVHVTGVVTEAGATALRLIRKRVSDNRARHSSL